MLFEWVFKIRNPIKVRFKVSSNISFYVNTRSFVIIKIQVVLSYWLHHFQYLLQVDKRQYGGFDQGNTIVRFNELKKQQNFRNLWNLLPPGINSVGYVKLTLIWRNFAQFSPNFCELIAKYYLWCEIRKLTLL